VESVWVSLHSGHQQVKIFDFLLELNLLFEDLLWGLVEVLLPTGWLEKSLLLLIFLDFVGHDWCGDWFLFHFEDFLVF
jgi:hypothetical protein